MEQLDESAGLVIGQVESHNPNMVLPDRRRALAALLILLTLVAGAPALTPSQATYPPREHNDSDMHGGGNGGM